MHRRTALALSLALWFSSMIGCDGGDEPGSAGQVEQFEDGVAKDTEGGAFRVSLFSRDGLEPGPNELIVRVGFHDPRDPSGPGIGIPSAIVHLDALAVDGSAAQLDLAGVYIGDGRYAIDGLVFDPGVWQLELRIEVGATLDESVEFVFEIAD